MKTVKVKTGRPYDILIQHNILPQAGEYIRPLTKAIRAVVVSDSNVAPLYAESVMKSLAANGFEVSLFTFQAGESAKRLATIEKMYLHFFEHNITRTDIVVALGGGVTGDMAGFAAASYLRGIDFVQIPTSLLSQVDSSVGGKTGVDLASGKNLVGAFWQPVLVLIDPETLHTLPEKFYTDGLGEVIKYGCIRDRCLFERLEKENARDFIDDVIYECVSIKRNVVENDERDTGERAILNFGHTFGHALEKLTHYTGLTHGEAVSAGAAILTRITEKKGLTEQGTARRLEKLLEKYHLPTDAAFELADIAAATRGDKKSTGKSVQFVFLKNIGECYIHKIDTADFGEFFGIG
ncbi:MAG: 3-dehydroquinate synthase [Clostridia bacterium]|nr:3-dehydroquinate synthase [Clostridia bacterium]